ncbi:hypothetical protein [Bradyrhizobium amphicarpaeae]|uniref:Uncharacterized protein n=1 Tax=Bradyrhizobium amphicarpaeae TaxID=1404768 RepID=A0A2U8PTZ8_9BRAD|nr:hypothetical protein [Bradyrhizobium amphicarpaeae]AWM01280.1 hypothetical protein CIT40_15395 [Bradyrhizobium amphicarpaeae]
MVEQRNDPAIQASHVLKLYFRTKDGKIADEPPTKIEQSLAIFFGTKQFALDQFFDGLVLFWTDELARLGVNPEFTV